MPREQTRIRIAQEFNTENSHECKCKLMCKQFCNFNSVRSRKPIKWIILTRKSSEWINIDQYVWLSSTTMTARTTTTTTQITLNSVLYIESSYTPYRPVYSYNHNSNFDAPRQDRQIKDFLVLKSIKLYLPENPSRQRHW